jgi:hypothetical protein
MWPSRCTKTMAVVNTEEGNVVARLIAGLREHLIQSGDSSMTVADYLRIWKADKDSQKTEGPSFIELKWVDSKEERP